MRARATARIAMQRSGDSAEGSRADHACAIERANPQSAGMDWIAARCHAYCICARILGVYSMRASSLAAAAGVSRSKVGGHVPLLRRSASTRRMVDAFAPCGGRWSSRLAGVGLHDVEDRRNAPGRDGNPGERRDRAAQEAADRGRRDGGGVSRLRAGEARRKADAPGGRPVAPYRADGRRRAVPDLRRTGVHRRAYSPGSSPARPPAMPPDSRP